MIAGWSTPAGGYLTLWPFRDCGADGAVARWVVGARVDRALAPVTAWGAVDGWGRRHRLAAQGAPAARCAALALPSPVTLCRAVGRGTTTLWERVEHLTAAPPADPRARPVAPGGTLVAKAADPARVADARLLARQLAGALRAVDRAVLEPRLVGYLARLDLAFDRLTPQALTEALDAADAWLRAQTTAPALPRWTAEVQATARLVAAEARREVRERYLPRIGTSYSRTEQVALDRLGTQTGWFLRDLHGQIDADLTARGRAIVRDGLAQGWGRVDIGRELRAQLPGLYEMRSGQYATVVAANAVSRARSHAELASYREAGITYLEVQAVLDERTTIVCRFMHGHIISVANCTALEERMAAATSPEAIYREAPFLQAVHTDADGRRVPARQAHHRELQTTLGARIARIDRSGLGRRDDRGEFRAFAAGEGLLQARVGPPPYHHKCRTYTLPRQDIHQVPANYAALAQDGEVLPGTAAAPGLRPVEYLPLPSVAQPTPWGRPLPLDAMPLPDALLGPVAGLPTSAPGWALLHPWMPAATAPVLEVGAASTLTRADLRALVAHHRTVLFERLGTGPDAVAVLAARARLTPEQVAALASHPGAAGRDLLVRVAVPGKRDQWIRVQQHRAPRAALQEATRRLQAGDWTAADRAAWLRAAERQGWLRTGRRLEDVALPPALRGGRLPPPSTAPAPPPAPPPPSLAPGIGPGLREVPLQPRAYVPTPDAARRAEALATPVPFGWARTGTVAPDGSATLAPWTALEDGALRPVLSAEGLRLTPQDALVHVWSPRDLSRDRMRRTYEQIIRGELERGFTGMREYILQDRRGMTWFVRYDGAAAARLPEQRITDALQTLYSQDPADRQRALDWLRANVASSTTRLAEAYPRAVVDWHRAGWQPGVPLAEQAAQRTAAVRRELDATVQQYLDRGLPRAEAVHRAVRETAGMEAAPAEVRRRVPVGGGDRRQAVADLPDGPRAQLVNADPTMAGDQTAVLLDRASQRDIVDDALRYASPRLVDAAAEVPAPYMVSSPGELRAYHRSGRSVGGLARPGAINMSARSPSPDVGTHEYQHHLDDLGANGLAARTVRNARLTEGQSIVDLWGDGKEWALSGEWSTPYAARLYGSDLAAVRPGDLLTRAQAGAALTRAAERDLWDAAWGATEYLSTAAELVSRDTPFELLLAWERDPDQIACYLAALRGAFVP